MWSNHFMEPRNEIDWLGENFENNILFQGYLCTVDAELKKNSKHYISWTGK